PARERCGFGVAHVDRPRQRQRERLEQAAPSPAVTVALPEQRMLDTVTPDPLPVLRRPPLRVAIAAGVDELEEPRVGHIVPLDRERLDPDRMRWEFVVPPEADGAAIDAERRAAAGDVDPFLTRRRAVRLRTRASRRRLLRVRQAMPHVEQRLLVHRFVLEN